VPHGRELHLYGPKDFALNVQGKLRGHLWNLLEPGQLRFQVTEIIGDGTLKRFYLDNNDRFELHPIGYAPAQTSHTDAPLPKLPVVTVATLSDLARVEAVILDHGTPVVGYLIQGPKQFHLKSTALDELNLTPGPWISKLQRALTTMPGESLYELGGKLSALKELAACVFDSSISRPFGYLTDFLFNQENLTRIAALMTGVEVLYCEATFRDEDRSRATAKKHLTTRQAAYIARLVRARELRVFHISNIYSDRPSASTEQTAQFFAEANTWTDLELYRKIEAEFSRSL
jgi:ribonuclease Z